MFKRGYINNFSQALLFLTAIIYLANYLMNGRLADLFMLQPAKVVNEMELWRLVTFPLSPTTLEGILLFIFTFWFISPKVEDILHRGIYPLIIGSIICLQGTVTTLVYWKSSVNFFGMDGVTFFVLAFFGFMQFNKKIVIWRLQPLKVLAFISLICFSWFAVVFMHGYALNRSILVSSITSASFGVLTAFILYVQIRFLYKIRTKKEIEIPKFELPDPDEMSMAYMPAPEKAGKNSINNLDDFPYNDRNFTFSEERLNAILDKMNEKGKDSLTSDEVSYLKEYSKFL